MKTKSDAIRLELERIAKDNGGVLWPRNVVDAARPSTSPLHSKFEWNDSEAAEAYRLWQARQLIRITVTIASETGESEKCWVSLTPDRREEGGYRSLVTVLSDADLRTQLLADALADMQLFEAKYRHLEELAEVFAAMARTRRRRKAA